MYQPLRCFFLVYLGPALVFCSTLSAADSPSNVVDRSLVVLEAFAVAAENQLRRDCRPA